jgi:hypothetical protein
MAEIKRHRWKTGRQNREHKLQPVATEGPNLLDPVTRWQKKEK